MIENKIEKSGLINLDLEKYYPEGKRAAIDLKDWLFEGVILREKDFREKVASHDWSQYINSFVAVFSSADAVIPVWAYMLIASKLKPVSAAIFTSSPAEMEEALFRRALTAIDPEEFRDKKVLVKGCSKKPVPPGAFLEITQLLQPVVSSLMYGEACSSVPVYKASRK